MPPMDNYLETAVDAARKSGKFILENLGRLNGTDINRKSASDFVTRVDFESERIIVGIIKSRFPGHSIVAEESVKDSEAGMHWVVDPLDGTTNFIHSYPMFSVSIALMDERELLIGVVYDPLRDELFTASKGNGAYLNEARIYTSPIVNIEDSLLTTGFPFKNRDKLDLYLQAFKRIFLRTGSIRRAGSAALDLAHVASGRCEGFFEFGLSPWDIAAGALLIKEAGGIITDFGGGGDYLKTGNVVAGNPSIHKIILDDIIEVFKGVIDS